MAESNRPPVPKPGVPAPTPVAHSPANEAQDAQASTVAGSSVVGKAVDSVKHAFGLDTPDHALTADPAHAGTVESTAEAVSGVQGIKVKAKVPGFYANERKVEGDLFVIVDAGDLGDWMEIQDPAMEKKHLEGQRKRDAQLKQETPKQNILDLA